MVVSFKRANSQNASELNICTLEPKKSDFIYSLPYTFIMRYDYLTMKDTLSMRTVNSLETRYSVWHHC